MSLMIPGISNMVKFVNMGTSSGSTQGSTSLTVGVVGNVVDRSGYDGVCFVATLGECVATAKAVLVPCLGDTSSVVTASSGTSSACAGFDSLTTEHNESLLVLDLVGSTKKWVGVKAVKATANCAVRNVLAILYNKDGYVPVTNLVTGSSGSGSYFPSAVTLVQNCT